MNKILMINPDRCTGCRSCELACSLKHEGEFNLAKARISTVIFTEEQAYAYVPITCLQCEEPACMEVCPSSAIRKDPGTGALLVDESRCVGCKMCIMACFLGSVGFDTAAGKAKKCDLCGGDPECVKVCTARALEYRPASDLVLDKKRQIAEKVRDFFKEGLI